MKKTHSTKRALLSAILALVMTVSMLVGTTFAWFTDSVTSANNKIVAGNLDVELHMYDAAQNKYVDISNSDKPIFGVGALASADTGATLWEPGKTQVVYLAIKNNGTLALKYKVSLNVTGIEKDLDKVLTYTITRDAQAPANMLSGWDGTNAQSVKLGSQVVSAPSVSLNAGGMHYFALAVHMDELAGNEYMGASISFDINVLATQLASEEDSFGPSYDDGAGFQEITSPSIDRPTTGGTEEITFTSASGVSAKVPAEVLDAMPAGVTEVSLNHSKPTVDGGKVVFEAIDFVDQNGEVIDLSENTTPVEVKLPLGDAIAAGTPVLVYHDGVLVDDAVVDADGNIIYNAAHFCEVEVKPVGDGEVVRVGSTVYESIQAAVDAAKDGDILYVVSDVEQEDGVKINNKNITIDFNGNTFTVTRGANTNSRNILINGTSEVSLINGTLVAAGDYSSGAYGAVRTEGTAKVTLDNLVLYNYRGNGLNVKGVGNSEIAIKNTKIYSVYGGGIEAAGATITVDNVLVEQKGMYTSPYNSMAISVNGGGKVTVNSGTFSTECITAEEAYNQGTSHGPWVVGVLNSGGELIINGGVFSNDNFGDNALATAARGMILADTGAKVTVNGGTFNGLAKIVDIQNNLGDASRQPVVTILGGNFSDDPTNNTYAHHIVIPNGYSVLENDGVYTVKSNVEILSALLANGGEVVLDKDYIVDASIVIPEGVDVKLNLNGKTITGTKGRDADNNRIHVIVNNGILTIKDGTVKSAGNDGGSAIYNNAGATLTIEDVTLYGAPQSDPVYEAGVSKPFPSYAVNNYGNAVVNGATIKSYHGAIATGGNGVTVINNADIDVGLGQSTGITSYAIYSYENAQVTVNGGKFAFTKQEIYVNGGNTFCELGTNPIIINGGNYIGTSFSTGAGREYVIYGGTFDADPSKYVVEGYKAVDNGNGTYTVIFPQESFDSLLENAVAGGTVELPAGTYTFPADKLKEGVTINCAPGTVFKGTSGLDINGATVVGGTFSNDSGSAASGTINGTFKNCSFTGSNALRWCYAGENVVFENCVFSGDVYGVHFDGGANEVIFRNCTFSGFNAFGGEIKNLVLDGCTFKANDTSNYNGVNLWGSAELIDCTFIFDGSVGYEWVDAMGTNATYSFTNCVVTDGTNEKEIETVVGNYGEGNTIVIDGVQVVASAEQLVAAVKAGATEVFLAPGEYNLYGCGGKTLTINGTKNTVIKVANEGEAGSDYAFDGSTVTFNGVTFDTSANNGSYKGFARMIGTYNDCTFEGSYALNNNSVFTNCTFNVSGDAYNIWTWGAANATFTGCTFNSDGKSVLLYGGVDTKLTVENCVFNDNGGLTDMKAAIEIGNDYGRSYTLIVNNTTVNGYEINDKGINTGSTLWGNKNSMGTDKLNVVVDGVDVY